MKRQASLSAECGDGLSTALLTWGAVAPPREERLGRQEELDRWVLRRFLLARQKLGEIGFPLHVFQGDAPDFCLLEAENFLGVEVTQAANQEEQAWMTKMQDQKNGFDIPAEYTTGERLSQLVANAIEKKVKRKQAKSMHWVDGLAIYLSTYDDVLLDNDSLLKKLSPLQKKAGSFSFVWIVSDKYAIDLQGLRFVELC